MPVSLTRADTGQRLQFDAATRVTFTKGAAITDHPIEECWEDYRFGQFQGPLITVLGAMHVEQTERGDDMFMAMISRAGQAIRDLGSLQLL